MLLTVALSQTDIIQAIGINTPGFIISAVVVFAITLFIMLKAPTWFLVAMFLGIIVHLVFSVLGITPADIPSLWTYNINLKDDQVMDAVWKSAQAAEAIGKIKITVPGPVASGGYIGMMFGTLFSHLIRRVLARKQKPQQKNSTDKKP